MSHDKDGEYEVRAFKALPRDPNQAEHKKPRAFIHRPNESAEEAESARRNVSYWEAARTIKAEDFTKVQYTPCFRNAMLPAIGGGLGVGAIRFMVGSNALVATQWATGGIVGIAVVAYNFCQRKRRLEKDGIRRAVEVLDKKQALKEAQEKGEALAKQEASKSSAPTSRSGQAMVQATAGEPQQSSQKQDGTPFWSSFKFW